ncbi:MAG: alpha-galactosidase [Sediminibacterium sp.]|nr:alpha-galactosidase [Sediminibacterium sp.]
MKFIKLFFLYSILLLPLFSTAQTDWLIQPIQQKANINIQDNYIELNNGLAKRIFYIGPNIACIDYTNLSNGQQLLRSIEPEARVVMDGQMYNIGGLIGQTEKAYLIKGSEKKLLSDKNAFQFKGYHIDTIAHYIQWKSTTWNSNKKQAKGKSIRFDFIAPNNHLSNLTISVHYNLYDGIPLITKWIEIKNNGEQKVKINRVVNEVLGLVEEESAVVGKPEVMKKQHGIYVETNYAFNNAMRYDISDQTTHWKIDSSYTSQVNYNYETPCLLEIYPERAPGIELAKGETFTSVRTNELLMDSYDRQRRGLMLRKMYRTIAPWTTQNPIFMHLVSKNDEEVKAAIDQCVATGYEAVILSFGSHLNMEDSSQKNIIKWKTLADYAHQKNILLGGYSLFSSRRISDADDVIDIKTGKPGGAFFGNAPCFGSKWGLAYRDKIKYFFKQTGFDIWENDGPYPGDVCASTVHPGHKGYDDSQWRQMEIQKDLYKWLNERGVYINAPDWYFLDGTHKIAVGYREVNFSLSRAQQKIINRQNIHDGTIEKTPSMGWGFVPLTKYQGGGEDAVLEPLQDHLEDYEQLMMQYYGAGVQACYRGPRLYDTDKTRVKVQSVIDWYKKYRSILNADMIQLRRADGRDWDGWLHVDPALPQKGLMMLFNPTNETITRTIQLPLYYTGLKDKATIAAKGDTSKIYTMNRAYETSFSFTLAPGAYEWFTIE